MYQLSGFAWIATLIVGVMSTCVVVKITTIVRARWRRHLRGRWMSNGYNSHFVADIPSPRSKDSGPNT